MIQTERFLKRVVVPSAAVGGVAVGAWVLSGPDQDLSCRPLPNPITVEANQSWSGTATQLDQDYTQGTFPHDEIEDALRAANPDASKILRDRESINGLDLSTCVWVDPSIFTSPVNSADSFR